MKVRTTIKPDEEIEVSEAEAIDLYRQGLLLEDEEEPEDKTPAPAPKTTEAKAK